MMSKHRRPARTLNALILGALFAALGATVEAAPCLYRVNQAVGSFTVNGATYRIDATQRILKNEVWVGSGKGTVLAWTSTGDLQTLGSDAKWWHYVTARARWEATNSPDPCPLAEGVPRLYWDQTGAGAQDAQAMVFRLYRDGSTYPVQLQQVICTDGPAPGTAACSSAIPSTVVGPHLFQVSAGNKYGESKKSVALAIRFGVQ